MPRAALLEATDGQFYGTTSQGGTLNHGTLFRLSTSGTLTILHSFNRATDGASPAARLVEASDGSLYGTTPDGGPAASTSGGGTVFRWTPAGSFQVVHAFGALADGVAEPAELIEGSDGNFYGNARRALDSAGTPNYAGAVYRMTPNGTVSRLHAFTRGAGGYGPNSLIQASDGNLYGTAGDGSLGGGMVFRLTLAGVFSEHYAFGPATFGPLHVIQGRDGDLYGITRYGPANPGPGTVFKVTLQGAFTRLYSFSAVGDGTDVQGELVQGTDGTLYVSTAYGGTLNGGNIFGLLTDGTVRFRYSPNPILCPDFRSILWNGIHLTATTTGTVLATLTCGGVPGLGSVLTIDSAGAVATLYQFMADADGTSTSIYPARPLIASLNGTLYGTTCKGGVWNAGTAYSVRPPATYTQLHTFDLLTDGSCPSELTFGSDGYLYGTTSSGGPTGNGVAFRLSPDGSTFSVLHAFLSTEGASPGPLLAATDGLFYGITGTGGGLSTLFRMTPAGTVSVLQTFSVLHAGSPYAPIQGRDGHIYGTTNYGIFRLTSTGVFSIVVDFTGALFPRRTASRLLQGSDGLLFMLERSSNNSVSSPTTCYSFTSYTPEGVGVARASLVCSVAGWGGYATSLTNAGDGSFDSVTVNSGSGLQQTSIIYKVTASGTREPLLTLPATLGNIYTTTLRTADRSIYGVASGGSETPAGAIFRVRFPRQPRIDYDGDGLADVSVYRPADGVWFVRNSGSNYVVGAGDATFVWGSTGDLPMPGDYDGDGRTDIGLYRPSTGQWFILYSSRAYRVDQFGYFAWGATGDQPIAADFDGDAKTDIGVYRPSTGNWFLRLSSQNFVIGAGNWNFAWGAPGDVPQLGDFDGDGKTDITVFRNGVWFIRYSSLAYDPAQIGVYLWGEPGDRPLVADFDGDHMSDIGIYRAGSWFLRLSGSSYQVGVGDWIFQWGENADRPVLGDFDGDEKTDITVYRPTTGQWFIRYSSRSYDQAQFGYFAWGATGDIPLPD